MYIKFHLVNQVLGYMLFLLGEQMFIVYEFIQG